MQPEEVGRSYDSIAPRWQDPAMQNSGLTQHERALRYAGPPASTPRHALDVGCGSSGRFIDLLQSHGYAVEGVDVSSQMIDLARARHPGVTFHHHDVCTWLMPRKYDFVTAWDSIWHVPLDAQPALLRKICAHLNPGGIFIFTLGGVDEPGEKRDAFMGPPMYHASIGIPATLELLNAEACVCRHLEYDQHPELHVYVIAQKRHPS